MQIAGFLGASSTVDLNQWLFRTAKAWHPSVQPRFEDCIVRSRNKASVILATFLVGIMPVTAAAQAVSFSSLEGHSIISDYHEISETRRFGPIQRRWRDRIYFSSRGRIFHKLNVTNTLRPGDYSREFVSSESGESDGRGAPFRWAGDGLTREWTNQFGLRMRQSVTISPTGGGYACRMAIERSGANIGYTRVTQQSCRVIKGNALGS